MIAIRPGGLDRPDVADLVRRHVAAAAEGLPPEYTHALVTEALAAPGIDFFTAWEGNTLLGMAALRGLGGENAGEAEVKSMRTAPAALRRGVGRALLDHLIAEARARGWRRLRLETGTAPRFDPANRLYERAGFVDDLPFAGYPASLHNRFMTLDLTETRCRP